MQEVTSIKEIVDAIMFYVYHVFVVVFIICIYFSHVELQKLDIYIHFQNQTPTQTQNNIYNCFTFLIPPTSLTPHAPKAP